MRPCALVRPDIKTVIEVQLFCNGVKQYKALASKLGVFFDLLNAQVNSHQITPQIPKFPQTKQMRKFAKD